MIKSTQNKGIALISIGSIGIIAALAKEWGTVTAIITGMFALLNLAESQPTPPHQETKKVS